MTVVSSVPSPWGEAAKGIFHVKGLDWSAVRLDPTNADLVAWSGDASAPSAVFDEEPPCSDWADILDLAERLAPEPALLPANLEERQQALDLAQRFCAKDGLGGARRLWLTHLGFKDQGGFPGRAAQYLAQKHGYSEQAGEAARRRVIDILSAFSDHMVAQHQQGHDYAFSCGMTAVDIYAATFAALFDPLPEAVCPMRDTTRAAFSQVDDETRAAAQPLLAHRDRMYDRWLEPVLRL